VDVLMSFEFKGEALMRKGAFFLVTIIVSLFVYGCNLTSNDISEITIKGVISNLKDAMSFIDEKTYLQLVFVPEDGRVTGQIADGGRLVYDSTLQKIPIPEDGIFTLRPDRLRRGKYLIVVQKMKAQGRKKPFLFVEDDYLTVDIAKRVKSGTTLDVGKVFIPVPDI
jgi:hypothetical protein